MKSKLIEALAIGELSWQDYANCRGADADLFFPERGASTRKAKAICAAASSRIRVAQGRVAKYPATSASVCTRLAVRATLLTKRGSWIASCARGGSRSSRAATTWGTGSSGPGCPATSTTSASARWIACGSHSSPYAIPGECAPAA